MRNETGVATFQEEAEPVQSTEEGLELCEWCTYILAGYQGQEQPEVRMDRHWVETPRGVNPFSLSPHRVVWVLSCVRWMLLTG